MCEAAGNLSHVSSGVLVAVKPMIYSNKEYSVFGNLCKQADGDNPRSILGFASSNRTSQTSLSPFMIVTAQTATVPCRERAAVVH